MTEQTRAALPVWMELVKPKCACCIQSEHVTHEQPEYVTYSEHEHVTYVDSRGVSPYDGTHSRMALSAR